MHSASFVLICSRHDAHGRIWPHWTWYTVLQEEKAEKALRMAEMEATKAGNIIDHEAEIYSRPKREWFQTGKERRASAKAAAKQVEDVGSEVQAANPRKGSESKSEGKAVRKGAICSCCSALCPCE
jgi:hypothetical protein